MKKENTGYLLLIILAITSVIGVVLTDPIKQDEAYHSFSDQNSFFGIPNFWNVASNLPFLVAGVLGLLSIRNITPGKIQYQIFFVGVALVSVGSGYYHFNPDSYTLIWDRLPMTVAFMAVFSIVISESIKEKTGRTLLVPLLLLGLLSILYWAGFDDLRLYALVQFYPILAIPVILVFFRSRYTMEWGYWVLLLAYIAAKFFEEYDRAIHETLIFISGHSLKHLAAAIGLLILVYAYSKRSVRNR